LEFTAMMNSDYGTYRLTYTPPAPDRYTEYPDIAIEMSTGGDANVEQMLRFFEAFLAASGYILKGELEVVEREEAFINGYWQERYFDLLNSAPENNSYPQPITSRGAQGVDFVPFESLGDDVITFGAK
jgi:hypothetical protein